MPWFIKRPREFEAHQFRVGYPLPKGVQLTENGHPFVVTIHLQRVYLVDTDWVVAEPDGKHYYPIKDAIMQLDFDRIIKSHAFDIFTDLCRHCGGARENLLITEPCPNRGN